MALSREYKEWHLTPNGWVAGTDRYDSGTNINEVKPPEDRLLTVKCGEELSSTYSSLEKYKSEVWRAKGEDQRIAELLEKYGDKEAGYPG